MSTPYMTTNQLIDAISRKISLPISQNTFTKNDIIKFINEEVFISQVPSVLEYHQEYFAFIKKVKMQTNLSRYPIPNRSIGMKLRDVFFVDTNNNIFEMTRIQSDDRSFFQANTGVNQAANAFYVEGNDIVLTPGIATNPTGSLLFVFYLRPNQLVKDDKSAIITGFSQTVTLTDSLISIADTLTVGNISDVPNLITTIYTAVNTLSHTISSIQATSASESKIVTTTAHNLSGGQFVTITGSNSIPSINGTFEVIPNDSTSFFISKAIAIAGSAGSISSPNHFVIAGTDSATAANLALSVNSTNLNVDSEQTMSATSNLGIVTFTYPIMVTDFLSSNNIAINPTTDTLIIKFNAVNSTYTDTETNTTTSLFQNGSLIDFLQEKPGHKIYLYDLTIPKNGISDSTVTFKKSDLMVPTGTTGNNVLFETLANFQIGDYMCLANEAIIPLIPPDLHTALAERTSARLLAALGDAQGLQSANMKIQEIETRQGNILDNRVEGAPIKIAARHSLLRYGKFFNRFR